MTVMVDVLIVGAGPTGLVLALWLVRLGVRVRIVDKAAAPGTTSRALVVQARTLELYRQVGLAEAVIAGGRKLTAANLWTQGRLAGRVPFGDFGGNLSPYPFALVYPQDAHEALLIETLARLGVRVERETTLTAFERTGEQVQAQLRNAKGAEETVSCTWLAGCDGAHSTVRDRLGIDFSGGTYSDLFYVTDVEAEGTATDGELHLNVDEADFLAVFPMKAEGHVRLVGQLSPAAAQSTEHGWGQVDRRAIERLRLKVRKVNWFSSYQVHHRVADSFRAGPIFLAGDAAHIHSPVGAQGMNTGIGDAVNLAWKLGAVCKGRASVALLDSYEPERMGFARRLVASTDRAFEFITADGALAARIRTRVVPWLLPKLLEMNAVRRLLFRTVSQISIRYPDSHLSAGAAGALEGGDRLPWAANLGGFDNFAPLGSLEWQVHVYGEPSTAVRSTCNKHRLPLHAFPWHAGLARAGFAKDGIYLVRPDGHIGLAAPPGDATSLVQYLERHRIDLAPEAAPVVARATPMHPPRQEKSSLSPIK